MKTRRNLLGLFVISIIAVLIVACGGDPTPTPTPPPTAAPTVAPQPTAASAGTSGGTLADALGAVKAATAYKVDLSIQGTGEVAGTSGATPVPGSENEPVTLVVMKGEVNGKDAHFILQGALTSFLGIEPDKQFEVISADGKAYLKGPVPLLGANEDKWYVAPPQAASVAQPPLTPGTFLDSFGEAGINPADFKSTGTESLDGQSCEVFSGDKEAVINAFSKLGGATGATQQDLDSVENAEFKFWVCPDGYLHQVKMLVQGHDPSNPDQKGSFQILMKITDFGADTNIQAPADAIELQLPSAPPPAAGPTPTP